jgi:hypothetical protein
MGDLLGSQKRIILCHRGWVITVNDSNPNDTKFLIFCSVSNLYIENKNEIKIDERNHIC